MKFERLIFLLIMCLFSLTACTNATIGPTTSPAPAKSPTASFPTQTQPASPTSEPSATLVPPSATPILIPSPTETSAPTATATPVHPLTIAWLRQQEYPASEIVVEQQLPNGANYYRYYVSYRSAGLKIYALLTIPFGEKPATGWPVVIFNHGFIPPGIYRTTERYVAYVDGFATNGYIVLRSDYRGHDQSEGEAHGAYSNPDYVVDVLNAVAAMRSYPDADPNRIGMWGHSMGGYVTLRAMVVEPDIKAGVIWAGVVGPYPNLFNRPDFELLATPSAANPNRGRWRFELFEQFGAPEENPEFWASISTTTYLADLSGPIQLHHGTADASVPFSVSELLYMELIEVGKTVEFFRYPGDDHDITNGFSLAMQRSIRFFDRYLKALSP